MEKPHVPQTSDLVNRLEPASREGRQVSVGGPPAPRRRRRTARRFDRDWSRQSWLASWITSAGQSASASTGGSGGTPWPPWWLECWSVLFWFFPPPHVFCLRKQKLHTSFQCFYSWAVISLLWPSDLCRPSVRCSSSRAGGSWSTRPCPTQPRKRWTTPSTPAASSPRWPSSCEWVG